MNVSRLIGGIICLLIAALLLVLYFLLPPNRMMFTAGDANVPWLPAIVLGILGVYLLVTAMGGPRGESEASVQDVEVDEGRMKENVALNKRLESISWGFFLVMAGGSMFLPDDVAPNGLWTIGVGLIMLGLNAARYYNGIRMSGFTTVLGIIAVVVGIAELLGFDLFGGAFLLIILGVYLLLKPYFDRRQFFGKAEES